MFDIDESVIEKPFHVDRAKTGRAGCKKCKQKIEKDELRMGKLGHNPFGSGTMKMWHHVACMFEVFKKQRATTRKIEGPEDIGGWDDISEEDRQKIMSYFTPELKDVFDSYNPTSSKEPNKTKASPDKGKATSVESKEVSRDNQFRTFRKLCVEVANASSYNQKSNIIRDLFTKGSDGESFKGDLEQWCRLLLPGVVKVVYNLQSKQLVKIFSRILHTDQEEMLEDLEKGDVAETIGTFFDKSSVQKPTNKAVLTIQEVDDFLQYLSKLTREEDQISHFTKILKKCTSNDLRMILRLVKHDLRINAGAKHVLDGLHPSAYQAFQTSRDIKTVVANACKATGKYTKETGKEKEMSIELKIMTPVLPMLAQACKSVEMALKKCPNGMFSEIKYDGERVQLHKQGKEFKYFSRSLKPVMPHKVNHFKDFIPKAFPKAEDLILDAEVLMVDTNNGKPLPFGSLGKHKREEFRDASVCLFVFDCIYYNGESLLHKPLIERKRILNTNMVEIENHIVFSEMQEVHKPEDLEAMMTKVFQLGLEGLVLKDLQSTYKPGKRHWLKVKKDYLFDGAMADSADLVVLGAWFGTGSKGGIMSSFLMGCYKQSNKQWLTVTKVHGGHDDSTLDRLQTELEVIKISKDVNKVPSWLRCTKTMVPDFVAKDPKNMPVWEISGAEFTCNQVHTADGISIRFPRVTKIRHDKDWKTATNFEELKDLYKKSKDTSSFSMNIYKTPANADNKETDKDMEDDEKKTRKRKLSSSNSISPKKQKKEKKEVNNDSETEIDTEDETEKPKTKYQETKSPNLSKHLKPKTPTPQKKNTGNYDSDTETETEEDTPTMADKDSKMVNPLHDIFVDTVIHLPTHHKDRDFLRKYIIAYGGILYDKTKNTSVENSKNEVTHVIYANKDDTITKNGWPKSAYHVYINWIWDSVKLLQRQNESRYIIK